MLKRFKLWLDGVKKKEIILYLSLVAIMIGGLATVMLAQEIETVETASTTAAATVIAAVSLLIIENLSFAAKTFQSKTETLKNKLIISLFFSSQKRLANSKFFKSIQFSIFKHLLPKNRREEILGDLFEIKQAMIEEKKSWLAIQFELGKLKVGIIWKQVLGKIVAWIEEQIKISK